MKQPPKPPLLVNLILPEGDDGEVLAAAGWSGNGYPRHVQMLSLPRAELDGCPTLSQLLRELEQQRQSLPEPTPPPQKATTSPPPSSEKPASPAAAETQLTLALF
jgi:hypothetical protein